MQVATEGITQSVDSVGGVRSFSSNRGHPLEEERQPSAPVARDARLLEQPIVRVAVALEEQRQVQERIMEEPFLRQPEGDEEPAEAPVTVEERVDRLELRMREAN